MSAEEDLLFYLKEHVERGVILLFNRVKKFDDLSNL